MRLAEGLLKGTWWPCNGSWKLRGSLDLFFSLKLDRFPGEFTWNSDGNPCAFPEDFSYSRENITVCSGWCLHWCHVGSPWKCRPSCLIRRHPGDVWLKTEVELCGHVFFGRSMILSYCHDSDWFGVDISALHPTMTTKSSVTVLLARWSFKPKTCLWLSSLGLDLNPASSTQKILHGLQV